MNGPLAQFELHGDAGDRAWDVAARQL